MFQPPLSIEILVSVFFGSVLCLPNQGRLELMSLMNGMQNNFQDFGVYKKKEKSENKNFEKWPTPET